MEKSYFQKGFALTVIVLFIGMSVIPTSGITVVKKSTIPTFYDGSLSGYVNDTSMNPIEGARVRVCFHGTYEENYTDSSGYYHVTNIPICWCYKNCTASKEGYTTEEVWLGVYENTTYDFVLTPLDQDCYPVFNGTMGWNGWWVSPVTVSFVFDPEVVAEIWYNYNGWHLYTEPFVIDGEGEISFLWYWVNYEGEQSPIASCYLDIDQTPPDIDFAWTYDNGEILLIAICSDDISGMAFVEFYMNELLQEVDDTPPYTWVLKWPYPPPLRFFKVVAYDNAGNSKPATSFYASPWKMYIFGFIRDPEFSDGYLRLHADFVITFNYYGIIRNQDLTFEIFDYSGFIGKRFIRAKLTGWWFPIPKNIFSHFTCKIR